MFGLLGLSGPWVPLYFERTVRDLVVEVRTVVSSTRFGFPSASTPLPV
jgi:hypothetical protein